MSTREMTSSAPSSEKKRRNSAPSSEKKKKRNTADTGESGSLPPVVDNSTWPNLLANYNKLNIRAGQDISTQICNYTLNRPLPIYLRYGIINLDKPLDKTPRQVVKEIKHIIGAEKTSYNILSRKSTGCLIVFIDRSTRLVKSVRGADNEYICTMTLHSAVLDASQVARALETLAGTVVQCQPAKRELRTRNIYGSELLGYDSENLTVRFWISCEAGTNLRRHCTHLGLILGVGAHIEELKRVKYGFLGETDNMVTIQDVIHAQRRYTDFKDESFLRRVVMPLETLLTNYKRIVANDSVIDGLCHGCNLMISGLIRFEDCIKEGEIIVMITAKGEAIGLGISKMTSATMSTSESGIVAKMETVVMDRGMYPRLI